MMTFFKALISYPLHLLKGTFQALAIVLLFLSTLVLLASYLPNGVLQWGGLLDLLTHLRLECLLVQLVSLLIFIILRDKPWLVACSLVLIVTLSEIVPYYIPQSKPFSAEAGSLKLLEWNVLKDNRRPEPFIAYVRDMDPDVIALQEVDQEWLTTLNVPLRRYPYRFLLPQDNNFGIALYSKVPFQSQSIHYFGVPAPPPEKSGNQPFDPQKIARAFLDRMFPQNQYPSLVATIQYRNHPVTVIATHPIPPIGSGFDMRNKQLADLAVYVGRLKTPTIVMGDMNCSPWSANFKSFLKNSGLKDSQKGFGLQASWPNWVDGPAKLGFFHKKVPPFMAMFLQTPIDHVLVSPQFVVLKRQLGPSETRSDHLPVFSEVAFDSKANLI